MGRNRLIAIIMALLYTAYFSSGHPAYKILCVHSVDSGCVSLKQKFNCTACKSLPSYILNVSNYFTSNTKMVFTEGNHCLSQPPGGVTVVNVTGISNFTMKGLGNVSYEASEEGAIKPSSIITCSCHQNKSGILFYKSKKHSH